MAEGSYWLDWWGICTERKYCLDLLKTIFCLCVCFNTVCVCVCLCPYLFFSNFNTYPIFVLLWSWLIGLSICIPYCIFRENVRIHLARVSIQLPPRYWAMNTVPKSMMIEEDLILWYILPNTWNQPEHVGHGHGHFPSMMALWQHWNQKEDRTSLQSTKNWLRLDLNWLNWKLQSFVCSPFSTLCETIVAPGEVTSNEGFQVDQKSETRTWLEIFSSELAMPSFSG